DIICIVNIQHDCSTSKCTFIRAVHEKQERLITSQIKDLVNHASTNVYIVNISLLYNY
ncbi:hypothetical protein F5I97DRAFT_1810575, partial [Phlebopus sp. FC_14]